MSEILYNALRTPAIQKIIHDLQQASTALGIDFFGIGALARNIWFLSNQEQPRGTKDIDFAVYVPNFRAYQALKTKLVEEYAYTIISTNNFCLLSPEQVPLDLLPFTAIEEQPKEMVVTRGLLTANFDGFQEVYDNGLLTINIEGDALKVCTIPAVVLLKFISYDDRSEQRPNDPKDIASILRYYPELEQEMIWEEYTFLYEQDEENYSPYYIGIVVLGYEIGKIIYQNKTLKTRLLNILQKAIQQKSDLARQMILDPEQETIATICHFLELLRKGITQYTPS